MNNRLLTYRTRIVIQVVVMTVLLFGCLARAKENAEPLITATPDLQTSATLVLENTATATALPTRKPTATFAPTRTPLPPQTDLPTIEPGGINAMIDSLYSRCKLPCWGSIIPGKTSQYAAKRFLAPLGEWYEGNESLGGVIVEYNNTSASISLSLGHGLVDSIHLDPGLTRPYRINRLFTEYGMPEDVRIEVLPLTAELTTWWWLVLLYPHQGFFAVLSAEGAVVNSIIHICPRDVSPDLYLFASNTYSLNEMSEIVSIIEPHSAYQPLNAVTDIDITQFYEIFSNQSVNCIATNVKFQLP
jgi:hypothetical protein